MRAVRGGTGTRRRAEAPTSGEAADRWSRKVRRRASAALAASSLVWVLAAASGLDGGAAWLLRLLGLGVVVALVALAYRPVRRREDSFDERIRSQPDGWRHLVARTLLVMGVITLFVVLLGALTEVPQVVAPLVAVVVGVHLLVLVGALDQPECRWAAGGLVVAGAAGIGMLVALAPHDAVRVVVGTLAALCLWGTAGRLALRP